MSVNSGGQQANGATYDVSVSGNCDRVAFTSDASNLALTRTSRSQWRSAVTNSPPRRTKQVYVRFIEEPKYSRSGLRGLASLASATGGRAGNRDTYEAALPGVATPSASPPRRRTCRARTAARSPTSTGARCPSYGSRAASRRASTPSSCRARSAVAGVTGPRPPPR